MAFWFYRGLRRGIATTRYPKAVDAWARALPSPPAFHSSAQTTPLADRLADACVSGALARDYITWVDARPPVYAARC